MHYELIRFKDDIGAFNIIICALLIVVNAISRWISALNSFLAFLF